MAHFAKLDENNVVLATVVVDNEKLMKNGKEEEGLGVQFLRNTFGWQNWKQYSHNTHGGVHYTETDNGYNEDGTLKPKTIAESADQSKAFRKNAAGRGCRYDEEKDAFIAEQPYPSWTLNETTCQWEPPVPMPETQTEGYWDTYTWDESVQNWGNKTTHTPDQADIDFSGQ